MLNIQGKVERCDKFIMLLSKTTDTYDKIPTKSKSNIRSKSTPDSITTIPIVNQKKIPLHFRPYNSSNMAKTTPPYNIKKPQIWACLVPSHVKIMNNKKIERLAKSLDKDEKKNRSFSDSKQKSEMLLNKYMVRKQKKFQKSPLNRNKCFDPETLQKTASSPKGQQDLNPFEKKEFPFDNLNVSKKWNYFTNAKTNKTNEDEQFSSIKMQRRQQQMNKIGQLNKIIKWRAKVASTLQDELERIKNDQMWKY